MLPLHVYWPAEKELSLEAIPEYCSLGWYADMPGALENIGKPAWAIVGRSGVTAEGLAPSIGSGQAVSEWWVVAIWR